MSDERKSVIVDAGFDNTNLSQGMLSAKEKVTHWAKEIGGAIAGAFAFEKILEFDKSLGEMAQKLSDTADRLAVNTDEVQRLQYAAALAGLNIDIVAQALDRLAKAKVKVLQGDDAKGNLATAFEQFGISFKDIQSLTPDELFRRIGDSIEKTGSSAQVTASMMELLGKSGGALIPMLKELRARSAEAPIISETDLENIKKASEALEGLGMKVKAFFATLQVRLFESKTWKEFLYGVFHPNMNTDDIAKLFDDPQRMSPKDRAEYEKKHPKEGAAPTVEGATAGAGGEGMGGELSPVKKSEVGNLYRRRVQILQRFKELWRHDSDKTISGLQTELTGINDQLSLNSAKTEMDKLKIQRGIIARDLKLEQTKVYHGGELEAQYRRIGNYSEQLKGLDAQIGDLAKSDLSRIADHAATTSKGIDKLAGTVTDGKIQTAIASK